MASDAGRRLADNRKSLQLRYRTEGTSRFFGQDIVDPGDRIELKGEAAVQLDALSTLSLLASGSWWRPSQPRL